jgi:hypothetical protein
MLKIAIWGDCILRHDYPLKWGMGYYWTYPHINDLEPVLDVEKEALDETRANG